MYAQAYKCACVEGHAYMYIRKLKLSISHSPASFRDTVYLSLNLELVDLAYWLASESQGIPLKSCQPTSKAVNPSARTVGMLSHPTLHGPWDRNLGPMRV